MKKLFILTLGLLVVSNSFIYAAPKEDVKDPVLKEVINELSGKMPRFINKYGESVFVSDEPITRASLLSAIYEYDKKSKGGAQVAAAGTTGAISRQEFDALKLKLTSLEKGGTVKGSGGSGVDVVTLVTELEPNMPMLLDNSLNNSKVFQNFKKEMLASQGTGGASVASSSYAADFDTKIAAINHRLDLIDSATLSASAGSSKKPSSKEIVEIRTALAENFNTVDTKIAALNKRLDEVNTSALASASMTSSQGTSAKPSSKEVAELKASLDDIQRSYVALSKRVDEVSKNSSMYASSATSASSANKSDVSDLNARINDIRKTISDVPTSAEVKNQLDKSRMQTKSDIERIEKKLNNMSSNVASSSSSDSGSSSGSTIAKISLGLTLVAALFVAR